MVSGPQQRGSRYVAGTEGAPPVPPAGGYRGARRTPVSMLEQRQPDAPAPLTPRPGDDGARPRHSWLGIAAICLAGVFAMLLVVAAIVGGSDFLYSINLLAVQFGVLAVILVALFTRRGRRLATAALALSLVCNVATMGGVAALRTAATGTYADHRSPEDKKMAGYPGVKGTSPEEILAQPSLEAVRTHADTVMRAIRERLTADYGFTWSEAIKEDLRPARNGYGGESMLSDYRSTVWATNEPLQDVSKKYQVMSTINQVLTQFDHSRMQALNDPKQTPGDPKVFTGLYGDIDPKKQVSWSWYTYDYETGSRAYVNIDDLSKDTDGSFRAQREAQRQRTGEPLEGLSLIFLDDHLLSDTDRDAFQKKLAEFT